MLFLLRRPSDARGGEIGRYLRHETPLRTAGLVGEGDESLGGHFHHDGAHCGAAVTGRVRIGLYLGDDLYFLNVCVLDVHSREIQVEHFPCELGIRSGEMDSLYGCHLQCK